MASMSRNYICGDEITAMLLQELKFYPPAFIIPMFLFRARSKSCVTHCPLVSRILHVSMATVALINRQCLPYLALQFLYGGLISILLPKSSTQESNQNKCNQKNLLFLRKNVFNTNIT